MKKLFELLSTAVFYFFALIILVGYFFGKMTGIFFEEEPRSDYDDE